MKIVIAGGTGALGTALTRHFVERDMEVVCLSRSGAAPKGARPVRWDGKTVGPWAAELEGADAVINLCGKSIATKWTEKNRQLILDSRLDPTRAIGQAIQAADKPPRVWINASAVGIYGNAGDQVVTEATAPGEGFMADVCRQWEAAADEFKTPNTRQVKARFGVVFGPGSDGFEEINKIAKMGLAAPLGSGHQYMSWIHMEDLCRCVHWCIANPIEGPVNVTSPEPRTNADVMGAFRDVHGRLALPPVPVFMVKAVAGLKGVDPSTLLEGQRAYPEMALARGFVFRHPGLESTLAELTGVVPAAWTRA
jgi:uncharacterized protein (TIGR01777 family)